MTPLFDLPLAELREHRTAAQEPPDLDGYWSRALAEARSQAAEPVLTPHEVEAYRELDVQDVSFSGGDGHRIRAWYMRPRGAGDTPLACCVTFIGYGGGRDYPTAHTLYPACGYATLVMDTRSQGGTWSAGDTPDPGAGASGAEHPGVLSRGLASPDTYYYRRLYVDAVRAVETAGALPGVDPARIGVCGHEPGRRAGARGRRARAGARPPLPFRHAVHVRHRARQSTSRAIRPTPSSSSTSPCTRSSTTRPG